MNRNLLKNKKNKVIAIVGATASGKTAYAVELAKEINGEIISADSRLVYKGFDIGTAKPSPEEQDGIPHYMIDIVEPEYEYSVALYKTEAEKHIQDILSRGKMPIVVGGTGLYVDTLLRNFDIPKIKPDKKLREKLNTLTTDELYKTLDNLDKEAPSFINFNDRRKLIRAIEIIQVTGKSLSESRKIGDSKYEVEWIGKNFDRKTLYERIDKRVDLMVKSGLVEETKNLLKKHGEIPNLCGTIGYREMLSFIKGEISLEDAKNILKQNTRRYAKRQLTWFRRNEEIKWDIYPEKLRK